MMLAQTDLTWMITATLTTLTMTDATLLHLVLQEQPFLMAFANKALL